MREAKPAFIRIRKRLGVTAVCWLLCLVGSPLRGGELAVDLRVVDETAPPGGLAVVLVELTEPKPISRGRIRLAQAASPLGRVVGAAILDSSGDATSRLVSIQGDVVMEFDSPQSILGTDPNLPFMAVAIEVLETAVPGQTTSLVLDLSASEFFDPQGQLYPEETQPGRFTVGGLSITGLTPLTGNFGAGGLIRIEGAGFDPDVDVNIQGANLGPVRVLSERLIEVTLNSPAEIRGTTRFRLRNPDDSEDFFYPAVLASPANRPPLAVDDLITTLEDTPILVRAVDNDSDPDGEALTISAATQPANGTSEIVDAERLRYTPSPDYHGPDSFQYTVRDARGLTSSASVLLTVEPVNDPPLAVDDQVFTDRDTPVTFFPLQNDNDADSDPLVIQSLVASVENPDFFSGDDGSITYVPHPLFEGTAVADYEISDGQGGSASAQVRVEVSLVNRSPMAIDDLGSTTAGAPLRIDLLANDSDPNGDPLRAELETPPEMGSVELEGGETVYRPAEWFVGTDTFSYRAIDPAGLEDSGLVTVVVTAPAALEFSPRSLQIVEGSSASLDLLEAPFAQGLGETAEIRLESSPSGILSHPQTLARGTQELLTFKLFGLQSGTAILRATWDQGAAEIPVLVRAGRVFEVPSLVHRTDLDLGLAVTNRGPRPVPVTIRGHDSGGMGTVLEHQVEVPAHGQSALLTEQLEGIRAGDWIEVIGAGLDVFPMFLYFGRPVAGFAGASTSRKASTWLLPFPEPQVEEEVDLGLLNHNPEMADLLLSWDGEDGLQLEATHSLAPLANLSGRISDLLPGWAPAAGSLEVVSSQPLNLYRQFTTPSYLTGEVAQPQTPFPALHIPHALSGQGWTTRLGLANAGEQDRLIDLSLTLDDGAILSVTDLLVPGRSTRSFEVGELFPVPPGQVLEGSLRIESGGGVAASALLGREGSARLGAAVPVLGERVREAVFSQVVSGLVQGIDLFTGLAVANDGDVRTILILDVYTPNGELAGHIAWSLSAGGREAFLLRERLTFVAPIQGGYLRVRSTQPVALAVMLGDMGLGFLSTVDAVPLP